MTKNEILAIAKPILFNTEMVRAILDNRKTATRRVVKLKYNNTHLEMITNKYGTRLIEKENEVPGVTTVKNADGTTTHRLLACVEKMPQYKVGDYLYVREAFCEHPKQLGRYYFRANSVCDGKSVEFGCPEAYCYTENCDLCDWKDGWIKWHPSIHMPKEAARIFLRVTGVRVERLRNMNFNDFLLEGVPTTYGLKTAIELVNVHAEKFRAIWDSTIKKQDLDKYGWDANPWVWVYEFERVEVDE